MLFPRGSSIGFLGRFGRSADLRQLDDALRAVDLHPRMISEAVKLTTVRLLRDGIGREPEPADYRRAAELFGYCVTGANGFAGTNGVETTEAVEARIEAAIDHGRSLDARLILLLLQAKIVQPNVIERFGLESG